MRNFDLKLSKQLFLQGNALSNNQVVDLATLFATANPSVSVDIPYTPSPIPVTFTTLASTFVDGFPFAGFVATNGTTTTILGATTEDGNPYAVVETNSGSLTGGMAVTSGGVQLYGASSTGSTTVAITGSDSTINLSGLATFKINDLKSSKTGMQYSSDYSAVLKGIDRSIPDVGTVKVLRQTANTWSTAGRPSSPAAGEFGYNSTTTVHEG